jgi:Ca-activated chloride channel family protein
MTLDYGAFRESLNALDTHIIPRGGTNITSAIREAQAALAGRPRSDKTLILVTDGEDLEGDAVDAAKAAARQGLKIYTVGVGTANGNFIPLPADQGGGFLRDAGGRLVKSRLDEATLEHIATVTGGIYAPLGSEGQGLETIYRTALAPLAKHDLDAEQHRVYIQRFQWPLAAALLFLIGTLLIDGRRRRSVPAIEASGEDKPARGSAVRWMSPGSAALSAFLCVFLLRSAHASPASAEDAYKKGEYATAEREYATSAERNPQKPVLAFNEGAAAYKAGEYPQAAHAFQDSLQQTPSAGPKRLAEQEDSYYDLGNTLYRTGQKTQQSAPQDTLATWGQAVKAYDAALQLRAADADAKFNRDLVNRKIEALKKQQAQNHSQNQKQNQSQSASEGAQQQSASGKSGAQKQPQTASNGQQKSSPQTGQNGRQPSQPQSGQPQSGRGSPEENRQAASQPTPGSQTPRDQKPGDRLKPGEPSPAAAGAQPRKADAGNQEGDDHPLSADNQRIPGQMSPEEARELLDSMKSEDRHVAGQPIALNSSPSAAPDQPLKDW